MLELTLGHGLAVSSSAEPRPVEPASAGSSIFPHFDVNAPMPPGHIAYKPAFESEIGCIGRARAALKSAKAALMATEVGRRGRRRTGSGER